MSKNRDSVTPLQWLKRKYDTGKRKLEQRPLVVAIRRGLTFTRGQEDWIAIAKAFEEL